MSCYSFLCGPLLICWIPFVILSLEMGTFSNCPINVSPFGGLWLKVVILTIVSTLAQLFSPNPYSLPQLQQSLYIFLIPLSLLTRFLSNVYLCRKNCSGWSGKTIALYL